MNLLPLVEEAISSMCELRRRLVLLLEEEGSTTPPSEEEELRTTWNIDLGKEKKGEEDK
jgi:hypothetical protein